MKNITSHILGDPTPTIQSFPNFKLEILCCRHWAFKRWKSHNHSAPIWRLYHNAHGVAYLIYKGKEILMVPEKIYLIAPNTDYQSYINEYKSDSFDDSIIGQSLFEISENQQQILFENGAIEHLFIHFNIKPPYNNISSKIFEIDLTPPLQEKIAAIENHNFSDSCIVNANSYIVILSTIYEALCSINTDIWTIKNSCSRILRVQQYIEDNLSSDLSNEILANIAYMSVNSFARLFKSELLVTPQKYIKKMRIDKACVYLIHSEYSIDEISDYCGFANRNHFTKCFIETTGYSPLKYKKITAISND